MLQNDHILRMATINYNPSTLSLRDLSSRHGRLEKEESVAAATCYGALNGRFDSALLLPPKGFEDHVVRTEAESLDLNSVQEQELEQSVRGS